MNRRETMTGVAAVVAAAVLPGTGDVVTHDSFPQFWKRLMANPPPGCEVLSMGARVETNATAFESNPWLMRAVVCLVHDKIPDATKIKVYRDGGLIAVLDVAIETV